MSSNVWMESDGMPYIKDIGLDQRIPEGFQTNIKVWVHEFTEWTIQRILYDFQTFPIYENRKMMTWYCHYLTSMTTGEGYRYKNHVFMRQPEDFHIYAQRKLDRFIMEKD